MSLDLNDPDIADTLADFKDEYLYSLERVEALIEDLQNDAVYFATVDDLYLIFHRFKGYAEYLGIDALLKTVQVVSDVMGVLRHRKPPVREEVVDWLLLIYDQMNHWAGQFQISQYEIESIDSYSLNMCKISSVASDKSEDTLGKLTVLVVEPNEELLKKLSVFLKKRCKKVFTSKDPNNVLSAVDKFRPDIIITETEFRSANVIDFIKELTSTYVQIPLLVITSNKDKALLKELTLLSIDGFFHKPLNGRAFIHKLEQIADLHYGDKWIKISDKYLMKFIETLKPLSSTVQEVRRIGNDSQASTRELATAITEDPPLVGKILKTVNSPLYGFKNDIESVQHAVSLLGKDKIVAMVLQQSFEDSVDEMDLSPYGITPEIFYEASRKRMELVTQWYAKVSLHQLPILSTTALLGNMGMIIIAKEVKRRGMIEEFLNVTTHTLNPRVAESELFHTSMEDVSADILTHWGLEQSLVDSIRYSHDLTSAPDEVKNLAIANYVTYTTIKTIDPRIHEDVVKDMAEFLEEMNFNPEYYLNAINKIS